MNMDISFLDNVHKGRKGLPTFFSGEGVCVDGMVGCVVLELNDFSHGGLLSYFNKFLEPVFEM
jgi:hypothetical protein